MEFNFENTKEAFKLVTILLGAVLVLQLIGLYKINILQEMIVNVSKVTGQVGSAQPTPTQAQEQAKLANIGTFTIDNTDPHIGNNYDVIFVEFADVQCPFCAAYAGNPERYSRFGPDYVPAKEEIIKNYVNTGKISYFVRDFPLSFHSMARPIQRVLNCIYNEKGTETYFNALKEIFMKQSEWNGNYDKAVELLSQYLDKAKVEECYNDASLDSEIDQDISEGSNAGVTGTPGFTILVKKSLVENKDVESIVRQAGVGRYKIGTVTVNFNLDDKKGSEEYVAITFSGAYPYRVFDQILSAILG